MRKLFYISFLIFVLPLVSNGQDVSTITKEISETFKHKKNSNVEINGERAEINIEGADVDEIEIKATIISKNESKSEAEKDIKTMKVLLEKLGKTVYIRNYISIKKEEDKPSSNLRVVFDIKLPSNTSITINNAFGDIQMTNTNGFINLNTRYSKINLAYLEGEGTIESLLGDVTLHSSYGNYDFKMSRCDLTMQNSAGSFNVDSKYGVVNAAIKPELEKLKVVGVSVDVNLMVDDVAGSYYKLISKDGKIQIDEAFNIDFKLLNDDNIQKIELNKEIDCSRLSIDTQFGSINLNKA